MNQTNLQAMSLKELELFLGQQQEVRLELNRQWDEADGRSDAWRFQQARIETRMVEVDDLIGSIGAQIKFVKAQQEQGAPTRPLQLSFEL